MEKGRKIAIRPIRTKNPLVKKGAEIMVQNKVIRALVDGVTAQYQSGLTKDDVKYVNETMRYKADLSTESVLGEAHPFWDSNLGKVRLEPSIMFLDTSKPLDFIHYHICIASPFVANSEEDYELGKYPDATHIIFDADKDAATKATKNAIKKKAYQASWKLSGEKKQHILMVLTDTDYTNKTKDYVDNAMDDLVEEKPAELLEMVGQDPDYIVYMSVVKRALSHNILRKKGLQIQYKESSLGTNLNLVVAELRKAENQDIFESIKNSFK